MQGGGSYRNVGRIVPLSEAVVETHAQPGLPHAVGEVSDKVTLGTFVDAVPVPVVRVLEVAPTLVVLGCQNHICSVHKVN